METGTELIMTVFERKCKNLVEVNKPKLVFLNEILGEYEKNR